jgi:peptidoglycan glycosyltransferase
VNAPVVRLFGLVIVLFALLVAFTSRWSVFEASALRDNPNNRRELLQEAMIKRGLIRADDGEALARSLPAQGETFTRTYPTGRLFAHPVGYSYTSLGRAGLERYYNDALTGRRTELVSALDSILGSDREGQDLRTSLNPKAQEVAYEGLAGRKGAAVALDIKTGAVSVMASNPSFDPNKLDEGGRLRRLNADDADSPLFNRATQIGYPPGSTFKVVTAAAALDAGRYTPGSVVNGDSPKTISGVELNNFDNESFGSIDLTTALTNSVNTVWAQVGVDLGASTMTRYMERFGFYAKPEIDYPPEQVDASGAYRRGKLVRPTSPSVDVGRLAIGQSTLLVTPLQMASVAQTIANGGVRMKPHLGERIVDREGRTVDEIGPERTDRVLSRKTARELTIMMKSVVREGTGTAAALEGVEVAGKTGTAEIDIQRGINDPWFIGFSGRHAVAVVVERVQGGQGGTVAAPIAKQILQALGE